MAIRPEFAVDTERDFGLIVDDRWEMVRVPALFFGGQDRPVESFGVDMATFMRWRAAFKMHTR